MKFISPGKSFFRLVDSRNNNIYFIKCACFDFTTAQVNHLHWFSGFTFLGNFQESDGTLLDRHVILERAHWDYITN